MKFSEYKYERPDLVSLDKEFEVLLHKFTNAQSYQEQNEIMEEINKIRSHIETMGVLVSIRHSINTEDEFYAKEKDFIDENMPLYQNMVTKYYKAIIDSKFRADLEKEWGSQIFRLAELQSKPSLKR